MGVVINAFFCASTISAPETKPKHVNYMYSQVKGFSSVSFESHSSQADHPRAGRSACVCEAPQEEFRPRQTENIQNGLLAGNKDKTYKRQMYCVSEWLILYSRLWLIAWSIKCSFDSLDPFRKIASNLVDDARSMVGRCWCGWSTSDWLAHKQGWKRRERRRREYTKITWIMYSIPADGSCVYTY